jgi:hypothetical protein
MKLYSTDEFNFSSQQFQVAAGEPELICGVRVRVCFPNSSHTDSTQIGFLTRQHQAMGRPFSPYFNT